MSAEPRGRLIQPSDADDDTARALYNGMIDKRPCLIARCVDDMADVITAINFACDQGLLLALRGAGHNGLGLGSCNDGPVIDLSMMKSVRVDQTKTVRVEGGRHPAASIMRPRHSASAVSFGSVSRTGIAGLTLSGGTGYLTREHGLTIYDLLEAEFLLFGIND